jgi:hypothetical protein
MKLELGTKLMKSLQKKKNLLTCHDCKKKKKNLIASFPTKKRQQRRFNVILTERANKYFTLKKIS